MDLNTNGRPNVFKISSMLFIIVILLLTFDLIMIILIISRSWSKNSSKLVCLLSSNNCKVKNNTIIWKWSKKKIGIKERKRSITVWQLNNSRELGNCRVVSRRWSRAVKCNSLNSKYLKMVIFMVWIIALVTSKCQAKIFVGTLLSCSQCCGNRLKYHFHNSFKDTPN